MSRNSMLLLCNQGAPLLPKQWFAWGTLADSFMSLSQFHMQGCKCTCLSQFPIHNYVLRVLAHALSILLHVASSSMLLDQNLLRSFKAMVTTLLS